MNKKDMEEKFNLLINPVFEIGETVYLKLDTLRFHKYRDMI